MNKFNTLANSLLKEETNMNKQKPMTEKQKLNVLAVVDSEGFDYAFTDYSSFPEIKDQKFHQLREAYRSARKALAEYIHVEGSEFDWS